MTTQELRRLGVLPYEDAPNPRHTIEQEPWFAPDGIQRVRWDAPVRGANVVRLPEMVIERTAIEPRARQMQGGWTLETLETRNITGLDLETELTDTFAQELANDIDREIIESMARETIEYRGRG